MEVACRALDRVLLWNYYVLPQFTDDGYKLAYWDKFSLPDRPADGIARHLRLVDRHRQGFDRRQPQARGGDGTAGAGAVIGGMSASRRPEQGRAVGGPC